MEDHLKILKDIERSLVEELEQTPAFVRLESIRHSIATFESGSFHVNGKDVTMTLKPSPAYNPAEMSWTERILYVIRKYGSASVGEIIAEINKLEPNAHEKAWLDKRVGVTVSQLKKKGKIVVRKVNKKNKYYIK